MKLIDILKTDEAKLIAWIKNTEPKVVSDMAIAAQFSTKALAWAKSPAGVTVEAVIASVFPAVAPLEQSAIAIVSGLLTDMLAVKNVAALEAIAERLGAEIWSALDGGKKPSGISGYIAEFQNAFVG